MVGGKRGVTNTIKVVIVVLVVAVVALAGSLDFVLTNPPTTTRTVTTTTTTTATSPVTVTSTIFTDLYSSSASTNSSLGLSFVLLLNSTQLHRGEIINITAYEVNVLPIPNSPAPADNWAETWFIGWAHTGGCNSFANAEVFRGYYTQVNISLIQAGPGPYGLQLDGSPLHSCPLIPGAWLTYFPFQPFESHAGYSYSASGYFGSMAGNTPTDFVLFDPGVYTVAAGDEWGQMVILHFIVAG